MSIIKGIKVGTTNITSTYSDKTQESDTKLFKVVAVNLYSIDSPDDAIYTGNEHKPHPNVKAIVNGSERILVEDVDYTLSYLNNVNSGEATITATGIGNFTGSVSTTWNIKNADMIINSDDQVFEYNGKQNGNPINVETVNNQEYVIKYGFTSGTYNLTEAPKLLNVSDSCDVYFMVSATNHNTVTGKYHITINRKPVSLNWGTLEWVYDGDSHSTTCSVGGVVSGDTCSVVFSGNSITMIGSKDVDVISLTNNNYELPSTGLTNVITIKPGMFIKISGVWTPVKKVYKKVGGSWVNQSIFTAFNDSEMYMKK